jgi:uncharacterized protein (TIGR04551 family)
MRAALVCLVLAASGAAAADDAVDEIAPRFLHLTPAKWDNFRVTLKGYFRVRGDVFNDFDLSRGPTPTLGTPIFPLTASGGHTLTAADMRVRLEPTLEVGQAVSFNFRVDVLDNVGFGSTPDVLPSTTTVSLAATQANPPETGVNALVSSFRVKRAWANVALPFGVLSVGRMGALFSWGTGFLVNNGDCISCDHGDAGDRVMLTMPVLSHYLMLAYDLSASGPYADLGGQNVNLEPRSQVNTVAAGIARYDSPTAQLRRLRAGRTLLQYGLILSYRWQDLDVPAWIRPGGLVRGYGPNDVTHRGLQTFAGDLWFLVHKNGFRAELEAALLVGRIDNASPFPDAILTQAVTSLQWGGVASLSYSFHWPLRLRAELGVASGTDGYGFGLMAAPNQTSTQKGDFEGPKLRPPNYLAVNNFRFNSDYHVDLILWRRIVGQVSDAVYIKPTIRLGPFGSVQHHVYFETSVIDSHTMVVTTPPGQNTDLGLEIDAHIRYRYEPAFEIDLGYGIYLPGPGFRNLELQLEPQPAQTLELILMYRI